MTQATGIAPAESVTAAEAAVGREDAQITELEASAGELTIETTEQLQSSSAMLTAIKTRQRDMAELRLSITRPLDEAKKRVMEVFKPALDRLGNAEQTIKGAVLTYSQGVERKRREEQARLEDDAERERLRLAALAERQEEAGHEDRAEASRQRAETVAAPTVARAPAPAGAVHIRTTWSAEVVDLAELVRACADGKAPLALLQPDMPSLNAMARTQKERFDIPGVKAVAEQGVAARRAS